MGRWAQRRLGSSSGSGASSELVHLVSATIDTTQDSTLVYSGAIDLDDFNESDFTSRPSASIVDSITQPDFNQLSIHWDSPVVGDTHVDYSGDAPGVLSPDTVNYS